MHAFANMPQNMLKFGTAGNISGQIGEQALKAIVKDHAGKTQWRPDKIVEQCAIREYKARQLDFIIKDVSIQLGINRKNERTDISKFQPQGKFTASFGGMNGQSMMPLCIHWHDEKKTEWASQFRIDSKCLGFK